MIVKIKVKATQTKYFPFDVVYLVHKDQKAVIPQLFPYSLCLPLNPDLQGRLNRLMTVDVTSRIGMTTRSTEALKNPEAMAIFLEPMSLDDVFLVIPILPCTHKKTRNQRRKDKNPAYLVAKEHRGGIYVDRKGRRREYTTPASNADLQAFFNDFAVLFTPKGPQRPICKMCPRHMENIQGRCSLGHQVCYESLVIRPEPRSNDEQLQKD